MKINTVRKEVINSPIPDKSAAARSNDYNGSKHAIQPQHQIYLVDIRDVLESLSSTALTFLANASIVKGF